MKFKTEVKIRPIENPISYTSKVLLLGSCFANNIGEKLDYFSFDAKINPFGIVFNPKSILDLIERAIDLRLYDGNDIFEHQELWHSFEVHSSMSQANSNQLVEHLNQELIDFQKQIIESSHIIITLGSAWVYVEKSTQKIVSNCHKLPQNHFEKRILSVAEIASHLNEIVSKIEKINPKIDFIWTVSPVRHQKDGFVENQRSKSHLFAALHEVIEKNENSKLYYFPSYELLMDELRDYRFYENDMLHPSALAIDFIWQKFKENAIDASVFSFIDDIQSLKQSYQHKAFNPNSVAHRSFLEALEIKHNFIQKRLSFLRLKHS